MLYVWKTERIMNYYWYVCTPEYVEYIIHIDTNCELSFFFILVSNSFLYFILFGAFIFFLAFLLRANCIELWGIVTNLSYLPSYRPLSQSFSTSNVINNGVRNCFLLLLYYYFIFDEKWASKVIVFDTLHSAHSSINSKTPCVCVRVYRRVDRSNVYSNL